MSYKKRPNFYDSDEAAEIKNILLNMQNDTQYNTSSSYSANSTKYPDNLMTFTEKHMTYLQSHPDVNPAQYIANLRLMTKVRSA